MLPCRQDPTEHVTPKKSIKGISSRGVRLHAVLNTLRRLVASSDDAKACYIDIMQQVGSEVCMILPQLPPLFHPGRAQGVELGSPYSMRSEWPQLQCGALIRSAGLIIRCTCAKFMRDYPCARFSAAEQGVACLERLRTWKATRLSLRACCR